MTASATGSARHSLAVATTVLAIALCCAAAVGGGTAGPIPGNAAAAAAPSSLLTKLPQPQLPKFPVVYTYGKYRTPRPQTTNLPTSPSGKRPQSHRPPAPEPQKQSQRPPQPQKQSQRPPQKSTTPKPTSTADERPAGRDPLLYQSAANATVTTSPRPKLETTTHDRAIITAPLKSCPEGQRMGPDRNCRPDFPDPEGD